MYASIRRFVFVACAMALAACNPMEQLEDGDAAVAQFHERLNQGQFEAIWADGHEEFKASATKQQLIDVFAQVRERMGVVKSTSREGFNLNTNNGVTTVKVTHQTEFTNGSATETFDFVREGDRLELWNYNINWGPGETAG